MILGVCYRCISIFLLLVCAACASAQTRVLIDTEIGSEAALGYKLPHTAVGVGLEQPFLGKLEIDGSSIVSPDHKADGGPNSFGAQTRVDGIAWVTPRLGLISSARSSLLFTSNFEKKTLASSFGVVFRVRAFGFPSRVYLDYLLPSGRYDPQTGIEPNRLQGPEVYWETQLYSHMRMGFRGGVYHNWNQGDPLCDGILGGPVTCPRQGGFGEIVVVTLRWNIRKQSLDQRF